MTKEELQMRLVECKVDLARARNEIELITTILENWKDEQEVAANAE